VRNALDALNWMQRTYPSAPRMVLGSSQGGVLTMAVAAQTDQVAGVYAHNVLDPALPASSP
jgi:alpha/beta superfamily hydrolase